MLYCSVDIETSGLDPENNQILSIGAIIEDTQKKLGFDELPKFNAILLNRGISGSPRALTMNEGIIKLMGEYLEGDIMVRDNLRTHSGYQFLYPEDVTKEFFKFLWDNGYGRQLEENEKYIVVDKGKIYPSFDGNIKPISINAAGKNFGTFDKMFLEKLPWWQKLIRVRQRVLDPAILFCEWNSDESLPSLTECKKRADIKGIVTHTALEDAWDVIELLRKKY